MIPELVITISGIRSRYRHRRNRVGRYGKGNPYGHTHFADPKTTTGYEEQ